MNFQIDFTQSSYFSVAELESFNEINQLTFIVPIFIFIQNNLNIIYQYASFLAQRPFIKTYIKPKQSKTDHIMLQRQKRYNQVLVRGTFDHLHIGHQSLILKAIFSTAHHLIIQVKDDRLLTHKKLKQLIQPVQVRKQNIKRYIEQYVKNNIQIQIHIQIITIYQVYGNAPYIKNINALIVSQQSIYTGKHINKVRRSNNGYNKVSLIVTPLISMIYNQTKQKKIYTKISSFQIRKKILQQNNFTIIEYLNYKNIWKNMLKQINLLCRVKDYDLFISQQWWQRIILKHSKKSSNILSNKEIYNKIYNKQKCDYQSLNKIAINLTLFLQGLEQQKSIQTTIKLFFQNYLKRKSKSKTCKKIRRMISNYLKNYNHDKLTAQALKKYQNQSQQFIFLDHIQTSQIQNNYTLNYQQNIQQL